MGGGGLTLAAGYRSFFVMGDVNYSQTDIGFDDRFKALIGSVRAGWNGKILDVPVRLWVGGVYWGTRSTARSNHGWRGARSARAPEAAVPPGSISSRKPGLSFDADLRIQVPKRAHV